MQHPTESLKLRRIARVAATVFGVLFCLYAARTTLLAGSSSLLSEYVLTHRINLDSPNENQKTLAELAVESNPSDPDAHFARGNALAQTGKFAEAGEAYAQAVALRPADFALWVELGRAAEQSGNAERAFAAYQEATRLAPFHVQTRWAFGNFLLRGGRADEAFQELRYAVTREPERFPYLIYLAWNVYGSDAAATARALEPNTDSEHLTLGTFFAENGKRNEAIEQLRQTGGAPDKESRAALKTLLDRRAFAEAYSLWLARHGEDYLIQSASLPKVRNGSFEQEITLDDIGFDWRLNRDVKTVRPALDVNLPYSEARSLRFDFNGLSEPSGALLSQLFLVEPRSRYRVSFAARAGELISGGLPFLSVADASGGESERELGKSLVIQPDTTAWKQFNVEFTTGDTTDAVRLILQRQTCASGPCPIYGKIWLDAFTVQKI